MSSSFTTAERSDAQGQSIAVLVRLIKELSLLRKVFLPYLLLMITGLLVPQGFLWLSGHYSGCASITQCSVEIPLFGQVSLSPLLLTLVVGVAMLLRIGAWALFEIAGQWAALDLHAKLIRAVSRVRTTFFDELPSGKLINRLVRDFENVRMMGVIRLGDFINASAEVLLSAAIVAFSYPLGALLILPTIALFLYIQLNLASMLHRCGTIRSVRFGEVLHRETDLIEGARTFVLYGKQESLALRLHTAMSRYIQIHLVAATVEAWGRFWASNVSSIYSFVALVTVAYALHAGALSAIVAAVIITVIFRLAPSFGWLGWISAYLLDTVAITRRVFEFVDLPHEITEEQSRVGEAAVKSPGFLLSGDLIFHDYTMSYRKDSPVILNQLSVTFKAGERIGIIGRTGAGKSSLVQSLYRMVYLHSGDISIGGQSIFGCDIDFVRSHFTVVPQDPYLFQGTLRDNLDRPRQYADHELVRALETVGIKFPLEYQIQEGGGNLSLGERQLICLARTIVTRKPFMIMDEPTSGIDAITDAKIQEVLNEVLKDCTVITIAHRLDTLARYDRIVELESGRVKQEGRPAQLLPTISKDSVE